MYDHGARNRNPVSTLWYGIDPLFEKYPDFSPYNYCAGNSVRLVDLDGKSFRNLFPQEYQEVVISFDDYSKYSIDYISESRGRVPETDFITAEVVANFFKYSEDAAMHVIVHGAISDKAKGDYLIYEDMICKHPIQNLPLPLSLSRTQKFRKYGKRKENVPDT